MIQILAEKCVVVKLFPDGVEGPGDDEDVAEADEEVVKEVEGLVPALGQVHGPDRQPRPPGHGGSQVTQVEAPECIEQEDEQDHEDGEPAVELHVEVDGANLVEEAGQDQRKP